MDKNILAYFAMDAKAEAAADKLRKKGFAEVKVNQISKFPNNGQTDQRINNVLSNQSLSIAALTQKSGEEYLDNVKPLLASSTVSSGLSGEPINTENWLVTVVTDEKRLEEARALLEEMGARL